MKFRYKLEPYKGMNSRYSCPSCKINKVFTRYIDTNTGQHIHDSVGICSRLNKCNYHYPPKEYFEDNRNSIKPTTLIKNTSSKKFCKPKPISFIPNDVFKKSLLSELEITQIGRRNNFVSSLIGIFRPNIASKLMRKYAVGTSEQWPGATVFWQIDLGGNIRTGKVMLYDKLTGKRIKEPYDHFNWAHKMIPGQTDFELKQCLFGEHLLQDKTRAVAVVESEKTAIIASGYIPEYIWVATGGLKGLTEERCRVLKNREVILFPDLGKGYTEWEKKAKELSHITQFRISYLLKRLSKERDISQGLDIADFLRRLDYLEFILFDPRSA